MNDKNFLKPKHFIINHSNRVCFAYRYAVQKIEIYSFFKVKFLFKKKNTNIFKNSTRYILDTQKETSSEKKIIPFSFQLYG